MTDMSNGLYQEIPQEPPDYEAMRRRLEEVTPEERLAAAMAYMRSRYARVMDPTMWAAIAYENYLRRREEPQ